MTLLHQFKSPWVAGTLVTLKRDVMMCPLGSTMQYRFKLGEELIYRGFTCINLPARNRTRIWEGDFVRLLERNGTVYTLSDTNGFAVDYFR